MHFEEGCHFTEPLKVCSFYHSDATLKIVFANVEGTLHPQQTLQQTTLRNYHSQVMRHWILMKMKMKDLARTHKLCKQIHIHEAP